MTTHDSDQPSNSIAQVVSSLSSLDMNHTLDSNEPAKRV